MYDMAEAYGVFANQGYKVPLTSILKITDRTGKVLEEYKPPQSPIFGTKVLPQGISFIISNILSDNSARALEFGENSQLNIPGKVVSVKTGTTNDFRDNWTIGYTPSYLVSVWVGNNDNTPMSSIASGITGAAPIWHDIMAHLLKNEPPQPYQQPPDVVRKEVCAVTGLMPDGKCPTRIEYFVKGTEDSIARYAVENQNLWVDKTTQRPPEPGVQDTNVELKQQSVVKDATGETFCVSCPSPTPTPSPSPSPPH